jgi:hypothetical protein
MEVGNSEYVAHVKHAAERPPRKSGLGWIREHSFECDFSYRPFTLIWGHRFSEQSRDLTGALTDLICLLVAWVNLHGSVQLAPDHCNFPPDSCVYRKP